MRPHTGLMKIHSTLLATGVACALAGAGAGAIINASATTAPAKTAKTAKAGKQAGGPLRRAVHAEIVIAGRDGSFPTVTIDRGTLRSVTGDALTLTEGTKRATYKTVTVSVGGQAVVKLDRKASSLGALKPGDKVAIVQGPKRTVVRARRS
jgi:hypothetical protein